MIAMPMMTTTAMSMFGAPYRRRHDADDHGDDYHDDDDHDDLIGPILLRVFKPYGRFMGEYAGSSAN